MRIEAADEELARRLASEAGRELLTLRDKLGFSSAAQLRREGDLRGNDVIMSGLLEARPRDAILSEEGSGERGRDGRSRLTAERVWIIDPLDGTREYGEAGRDDWAVHVALWAHGELALGVVALPAQDLILSSEQPPPKPEPGDRVRIAVSRSRPPGFLSAVVEALDAELVPMGSAGAKVSAVVLGKVDAYVHAGGQFEWDSAAPVAIAEATGLHASRIDGAPLTYNNPNPRLDDLVVCRAELSAPILGAIAKSR
ncbi:3'(2'),5'-bisphosphate nucleotidase [Stackebrandtia endophytica]|uniref:3'(2'),5'-bisphosphate nucleotidase n=1 Tax=Stackebrandtia endophytica TaxID=1496996 RepID=A0A543B0A8_9ACTN|nr:3'(2'),5'-bisphosphate nucleotidase CysQ [Stackebrandtia endophytica]TQL78249.1 3'(2'),5'-bisphosphate nucleotidase [Stackebrandtia endophytica]